MGRRNACREGMFACLNRTRANSLDHGASNGVVLSLLRFHGFFELAVGFFHGHGNVDRSFLTFRARLTTIFFFFQHPCAVALFRIIIPPLLDKIFRPMDLSGPQHRKGTILRASDTTSYSFHAQTLFSFHCTDQSYGTNAPARLSYPLDDKYILANLICSPGQKAANDRHRHAPDAI